MPAAGVNGSTGSTGSTGSGIIIDDREEPRLITELERFNVPIAVFRLEGKDSAGRNVSMGDAVFSGSGPNGQPVQIAFERKKLDDLVTCIKDRRLNAQLRDMRDLCGYDRIYVVIEGIWKPSAQGTVDVMNGGGVWRPFYSRQSRDAITFAQIDGYLESLSECGGVRVVRTGSVQETAHLYVSRYNWWQKPYHQHRAHDQIYSNDPESQRRGRAILHQGTPGPVCQFAAQLPGVDSKSWSVAEQYGSVHELVTGRPMTDYEFRESVNRWMQTTWTDSSGKVKRFGRKTATEIVGWLRRNK